MKYKSDPLFYRGFSTLFHFSPANSAKMQIPLQGLKWIILCFLSFVWRQLELAFFGAATPVVALLFFLRRCVS